MATTNNPWQVAWTTEPAITCDAQSRLERINRSNDMEWLRAVVAWPDNQKTVQQAAERRLRMLTHK